MVGSEVTSKVLLRQHKCTVFPYKNAQAFIAKMMVLSRCLSNVGVQMMLGAYLIVIAITAGKARAPCFDPTQLNHGA